MKIGVPKALLYHRYDTMWTTFFEELGCEVVLSGDTNQQILSEGISLSVGECCLPVKVFLGHVQSLLGRCDRIFVPRFERLNKNEEFCVRFWGLVDIVSGTFPEAPLLSYNHRDENPGAEALEFLRMGRELNKNSAQALRAYRSARKAQLAEDLRMREQQREILQGPGLKVLVAAQPYIVHDPYIGGPLVGMIREQGAVPVFADRCDRQGCRRLSKELTSDLYWIMNKEVIGAIPLLREHIDGVILVTAFPCGTDCLVNELALRRLGELPAANIVLDEQQGEAGLRTRIECFIDILQERRRFRAS